MSGPHDFDLLSRLCRRCGIGEAWADYRPACDVPERRGHDWCKNDVLQELQCHRCGAGVDADPVCPGRRPAEPQRAPTAPAIADMLDRALTGGAFDRIDRRHKPWT